MICYEFELNYPLKYNLTGKFQSPSPDWMHFTREMEDYELIIMTEGCAYMQIDEKKYTIKKGEFLLYPPSVKQCGYKESTCAFYWLHFHYEGSVVPKDYEEIPEQKENKIYIPVYGKIDNLEKIIVMMKHLQDNVRSYHNSLHNNYVCTTILSEIYSQYLAKQYQENTDLKRKQLYNDIKDYIKWYRNKEIKVSEIAEHFGYNKRYLSYLFNSIAGITLKQYILQEKVALAKYLLCDTNKNINEIAYECGFHDSHNFMKMFKNMTGLTPTQYRNAYASRILTY